MIHLVLLRHGCSVWNKEQRFTGWSDVSLTDSGVADSERAGVLLAQAGLDFDVCLTSVLERGVEAARACLRGYGAGAPPLECSWRLNERHFGALQGMGRLEACLTFGPLYVMRLQRSYSLSPPPLAQDDPRSPLNEPVYKELSAKDLPLSESLEDTYARTIPFWFQAAVPRLQAGRSVLVVAHKNSLRVLMKEIENLPDSAVPKIQLPTGEPLVYTFDDQLKLSNRRFLVPQRRKFQLFASLSPG